MLGGSSLKGALRARAEAAGRSEGELEQAFGSEKRAGALPVRDALMLALPLRVATGGGVLLTSPLALARFGRAVGGPAEPEAPPADELRCVERDLARLQWGRREGVQGGHATTFVEELDLLLRASPALAEWSGRLERSLGGLGLPLVLGAEELFAHATRAWTELRHRNAVGPDGVVRDKFLYTVEACPPGTLWWTECEGLEGWLPEPGQALIVGGHKSVGMGRISYHEWSAT
jgi:CRISPR/Cas system CMR subunit Cmr4 (Cas7 group RAMP superfamily)